VDGNTTYEKIKASAAKSPLLENQSHSKLTPSAPLSHSPKHTQGDTSMEGTIDMQCDDVTQSTKDCDFRPGSGSRVDVGDLSHAFKEEEWYL
jgi:hypothetical protein